MSAESLYESSPSESRSEIASSNACGQASHGSRSDSESVGRYSWILPLQDFCYGAVLSRWCMRWHFRQVATTACPALCMPQ
eukprot:365166-Chlamydomonas_euryale.AAC.9